MKISKTTLYTPPPPRAKGFTLIELLVVVLIIGILAAVALPQYRFAVEKAYASEAIANVGAIKRAINIYWMDNGSCPPSIDDMPIDIPHSSTGVAYNGSKSINTATFTYYTSGDCNITVQRYTDDSSRRYDMFGTPTKEMGWWAFTPANVDAFADKIICQTYPTRSLTEKICASLGTNPTPCIWNSTRNCYFVK